MHRLHLDRFLLATMVAVPLVACSSSSSTSTPTDSGNPTDDSSIGADTLGIDVPNTDTADGASSDSTDTASGDDTTDTAPACDPSHCPSGSCNPDGTCTCSGVTDCPTTAPKCDTTRHACVACLGDGDCSGGKKCCDEVCTDVTTDDSHCGACGTACTSRQTCVASSCVAVTLGGACPVGAATIADDTLGDDITADGTLSTAFTSCMSASKVHTISQDTAGLLDPTTGRPLLGPGNLYVAAGGPFGQKAVAYLQTDRTPLVYAADSSTASWTERATGTKIVSVPVATLTDHHDWFALQMVTEPKSSTLVFIAFGGLGDGTKAAAWYFANHVLSTPASLTKGWMVVEWIDNDGDGLPSATDTFNELATGS